MAGVLAEFNPAATILLSFYQRLPIFKSCKPRISFFESRGREIRSFGKGLWWTRSWRTGNKIEDEVSEMAAGILLPVMVPGWG
jgi:hypothetical protein